MKVSTLNLCGGINSTKRFYGNWGPLQRESKKRNLIAKKKLEEVKDFIRENDIEIIALQELDRSGFDQLSWLSEITEMEGVYGKNYSYNLFGAVKVDTGNAILSRNNFLEVKQIEFPRVKRLTLVEKIIGRKRLLVTTTKDGIHIISAHLTHNDDLQKELEFRFLVEYCIKNTPSILLGDLNTMPPKQKERDFSEKRLYATDRCHEILEEFLSRSQIQIEPSLLTDDNRFYTSGNPLDKTIDYIMLFSDAKYNLKLKKTYRQRINISDHEPLIAEIE